MGGLCGAICCADLSYIGGGFCNNLIPATSPIPGNVIFGGECNGPIQDDPLYNVITGGHANRMGCYLSALAGACGNYMDGGFSAVLGWV